MANPRDTHYEAHRVLSMNRIVALGEAGMIEMVGGALLEAMNEVRDKMLKEGSGPNNDREPEVIITFSAFGGKHHATPKPKGGM